MTVEFTLNAEARSDLGKGASRRLRRLASLVPAVVYGGEKAPESISMLAKEVAKLLENEAAYSHIIELNVGGTKQNVIIKALQRHPAKGHVMHADFVRVVAGQKLTAHVPLHFINEATSKGVKIQGGKVVHNLTQLDIICFPHQLPEFIEVDLGGAEVGTILHISDLKLPAGVVSADLQKGADHNLAVATVVKPKGAAESEGEEA
mgnify:CR=1 FL=1